ncbi:lipid transfer-like protein VAS isoform X1 [Carex littledalei]|uniref:Lipid transfer-like protein VAS isoform X1 n=1 Tax=Carex littledalei TaxID=544730 RepID=A0A833RAR1_9POAL|nr:lipid transfer-like protein VAS isoform X1 [Carex littledalei]
MAFDLRTLALFVAVSALAATAVSGQDVPPCASNLAPCASYLNSTATPPETCCGPLKDAAVKQAACLCNLLNNKELLKSFNIDPAQALRLAKSCNTSVDASTCSKASAPTTRNSTNSAQKVSWTVSSGIMCLLSPFLLTVMA